MKSCRKASIRHCVRKRTLCRQIVVFSAYHVLPLTPLETWLVKIYSLAYFSLITVFRIPDNYVSVTLTIGGSIPGISAFACFRAIGTQKKTIMCTSQRRYTYARRKSDDVGSRRVPYYLMLKACLRRRPEVVSCQVLDQLAKPETRDAAGELI